MIDRRVFIGMPGYGQQTAGAGRAFWRATRLPDRQVVWRYREGSLLAANFNGLWAEALTRVRRGERIDYFAMIHADVQPTDYWADALIDELEARDLDVLGVAVPIKDSRGLTSLALARPDGDPWRPLCRLTMAEVHRLPETFTSDDVGHPLLFNTGLWACRFDPGWCRKVHFTVNDRIVDDVNNDRYLAEVEPEDWFFSRLCHELGLRIGATRKVHCGHRGDVEFRNDVVWGAPHDAEYVEASILPADRLDGFEFPHDVDGWLLPQEGRALAGLARGKRVLEVGSYCGKSTICLAREADRVTAVDPHDGRATPRPRDTLAELYANLDRRGVRDRVDVVIGTIDDAPAGPFDLAFIDGDHSAEAVRRDIAGALARLAPGGLLAFHDYRDSPGQHDGRWDPGVTQAVDELLAAGGEIVSTHATLAVVEPPAAIPLEV